MPNLTTTTQVDPGMAPYYDRVLLERAVPMLHHLKFADVKPLPAGSSDQIKWRRYSSLSVATAPLSEGVTPSGQVLAKTDIEARVQQYGDYVHLTDVVNLVNADPVITETTELQGEQMGETFDNLVRDYFGANASSTTCSNGTTGTATDLNATDIFAVVQTLLGNNAKFITNVLTAATGVGTQPVRQAFWGIVDTDLLNDLQDCSGFVGAYQYPNQRDVQDGEWGECNHVRFMETSIGYVSGSSYHIPILGKHAYGTVKLEGGNAKSIVKALGSGGTSDPLDQRMTIGWKSWFAVRILNDDFMHQLICTNY